MRGQDALAALRREADAARFGATALYLLGLTARDEAGGDGDGADEAGRFSLVERVRLELSPERRLGAPIDVTTRGSPAPLLRERIEASAGRVYLKEGGSP